MRRVMILLILCGITCVRVDAAQKKSQPSAGDEKYGGIKLLEGYQITRGWDVDAAVWSIHKTGGLTINYAAGLNEGRAADPATKEEYSWFREQTINGHKVFLAFIGEGVKTGWEPADSRGLKPGNILLITFPMSENIPSFAANFRAKIAGPSELADVLLMVLTFDPSKWGGN